MKKLAIITTHPIQYNAPWFRLLSERKNIKLKVFYTWSQVQHEKKFDPGFGKIIDWDIPLLEGYDFTFVNNTSKNPNSKTFKGIQNPTLIKEVEKWNPDAVLIFGWKFKSHLRTLRYFKNKIPVLFRGDSTLLMDNKGIKNRIRHVFLSHIYKDVDYVLHVGKDNKRYFKQNGIKEDQLFWAPNAVDNYRFMQNDVEASLNAKNYRRNLKIDENAIVFLYAGKFEAVKNLIMLLRTAAAIKNETVHFLFVGNGPLEKEMEKFASDQIHFLGFQNQNEMPTIYRIGDVVVLPSKSETWGLAVNEAMACSRPVLVSDRCGCVADLVENGVTGYVFKSNNEQDLKAKIELIISQKDILQNMGKSAFERIQDWSFEKIATTIEKLVNEKCN